MRRLGWTFDLALVVLAWRLAINPYASWWRDPPAILAVFWMGVMVADPVRRPRAVHVLTLAVMAALLALFAVKQVPLTLGALGLSR